MQLSVYFALTQSFQLLMPHLINFYMNICYIFILYDCSIICYYDCYWTITKRTIWIYVKLLFEKLYMALKKCDHSFVKMKIK